MDRASLNRSFPEVRRRRRAKGWSQKQLADKAGVTQATVSYMETGVVDTSSSTLEKIASALECPVADLFATDGDDDIAEAV